MALHANDRARLKALKSPTHELPEMYMQILDRLGPEDENNTQRELALRALAWLLYCKRCGLKLHFLATAASINPNEPFSEEQRIDDDGNILEVCRSLITINNLTDMVELSHFSVTQFLQIPTVNGQENPYYMDAARGNSILMRSCLMYLRSPVIAEPLTLGPSSPRSQMLPSLSSKLMDPFVFYAILYWPTHATMVASDNECMTEVFKFLRNDPDPDEALESDELVTLTSSQGQTATKDAFGVWCRLWESDRLRCYVWWEHDHNKPYNQDWLETLAMDVEQAMVGGPVYYSALLGLPAVIEKNLDLENQSPNVLGGSFSYPLLAAVRNQHESAATVLLQRGASINTYDPRSYDTSLHFAISDNNLAMVKMLLHHNPDLSFYNRSGDPPLHVAVRELVQKWSTIGNDLVKLLAIQPDVKNVRGETALHLAVSLQSVDSVKLLLEHNADINATNRQGRSVMHLYAVTGVTPGMFELLLSKSPDLDSEDLLGYRPLHMAVMHGKKDLIVASLNHEITTHSQRQAALRLDALDSPLDFIIAVKSLYPHDVRFESILADVYFTNRMFGESQRLYEKLLVGDRIIATDGPLKHRAFCSWCCNQIKGIRVKCVNQQCCKSDWCSPCFQVKNGYQSGTTTISILPGMVNGVIFCEDRVEGAWIGRVIINPP